MPFASARPGRNTHIRIVFDTNLLIAALTNESGASAAIVDHWRHGALEFVVSQATLREAQLVLGGKWVARVAQPGARDTLLDDLAHRATMVEAPVIPGLALRDEGDRRLVEAAVAGKAEFVVTSDREVLLMWGYGDVRFVTPSEFLRLTTA